MYKPATVLVTALLLLSACHAADTVTVQTAAGVIEGDESNNIRQFLGIPYAAAPVNELRWAPPVPVANWQGIKETRHFGAWCPQPDFDRRDEGSTYAGEGWTIFHKVPPAPESNEDCLNLNVWAPATAQAAPVLVFLHGNALGTSFPIYNGSAFARDGIVFVSINFRLLTMGNFAHPNLSKLSDATAPLGRFTELDQLAALQWIQKNIAAFGGDPANVTLVGSSAGGASILQMLTTPAAKGLFHKAIVQSGNGWWEPVSHADHEKIGCLLMTMAGLDGCNASAEAMRKLPWQALPFTDPYALDGRRWQQGATEVIAAGGALDIPLMIGWNDFDGSSLRYSPQQVIDSTAPETLAAYERGPSTSDEDLAYSLYTDLHSGAPARWVASKLETGQPVYLYLFSYVLTRERDEKRGAEHAYELPHVFDSWNEYLSPLKRLYLTDEDRSMTALMHACWVSFIKQGKPQCPGAPEWPAYTRGADQLMELNLQPRVLTGFRAKHLNAQEQEMNHFLQQEKASIQQLIEQGVSGVQR